MATIKIPEKATSNPPVEPAEPIASEPVAPQLTDPTEPVASAPTAPKLLTSEPGAPTPLVILTADQLTAGLLVKVTGKTYLVSASGVLVPIGHRGATIQINPNARYELVPESARPATVSTVKQGTTSTGDLPRRPAQ